MQIVIDIDENLYTRLFNNGVDNYDDAVDMAKAIRKGTPLPKGHGKIGDLDRLYAVFERNVAGVNAYKPLFNAIDIIIEADKMRSEDNE